MLVELDGLQQANDFVAHLIARHDLEALERAFDLRADAVAGVHGRVGVLKDHLQLLDERQIALAGLARQVEAKELNRAAAHVFQADDRLNQRALAAARFANHAQGFAGRQREADAIDGFDIFFRPQPDHAERRGAAAAVAVVGFQALDVEQRIRAVGVLGHWHQWYGIGGRLPRARVDFFGEEAAALVLLAQLAQRRALGAAHVARIVAARLEHAAGRQAVGRGHAATDGVEQAAGLVGTEARHAAHQALRVRVARVGENFLRAGQLNQLAGIHHAHAVAHPRDHAQVMANKEDSGVEVAPQVGNQVEHCRLDGHVQRGGRLVHDQQGRVVQQRHCDHHALLLAARNLVRVATQDFFRVGHVHAAQHLNAAGARLGAADAAMHG